MNEKKGATKATERQNSHSKGIITHKILKISREVAAPARLPYGVAEKTIPAEKDLFTLTPDDPGP
jgi:hypothetical protein